jgi:predicted AAA+ superfamily ATPase
MKHKEQVRFRRQINLPNKSFLLLGPRGTGKSTWLRSVLKPDLEIDLLKHRQFLEYSVDPSKLQDHCKSLKKGAWVLIDEIQKIPALMDEAHSLYESMKINFALTGSSARKLKRGGANLMGGRTLMRNMFPLVHAEYKEHWSIDQSLKYGALPLIVSDEKNAEETLYSYVNSYLKEELVEEGIIRKLEPFARFLKTAAMMNAQLLNIENIARESSVKRVTVDKYFEVLIDTLIAFRVDALKIGYKAREASHPKFYFFDAGIARACSQLSLDDFDSVLQGFAFETVMINEIRAHLSYSLKHYPLYHYTISGSYDIDLMIETRPKSISKPRQLVLIEFKNTKRLDPRWADPMLDFKKCKKAKILKLIVVYRGTEQKTIHDVEFIPAEKFLEMLADGSIL